MFLQIKKKQKLFSRIELEVPDLQDKEFEVPVLKDIELEVLQFFRI